MTFTLFVTYILTFFVGYTASHYTVTTWNVRPPVAIVVGVIVGVFAAVFATFAVAPLVHL